MRLPVTVMVTPLGIATGSFPIRDIEERSLPDEGEKFTARPRLTRLTVSHQALRRAENRDAESVAHARNLRDTDVPAQTRARHALQLANHRQAAFGVLED